MILPQLRKRIKLVNCWAQEGHPRKQHDAISAQGPSVIVVDRTVERLKCCFGNRGQTLFFCLWHCLQVSPHSGPTAISQDTAAIRIATSFDTNRGGIQRSQSSADSMSLGPGFQNHIARFAPRAHRPVKASALIPPAAGSGLQSQPAPPQNPAKRPTRETPCKATAAEQAGPRRVRFGPEAATWSIMTTSAWPERRRHRATHTTKPIYPELVSLANVGFGSIRWLDGLS